MTLKSVLKSKNKKLYYVLESVTGKAELLLSRIVKDFPQYTSHDIKHSELVITRLDTIISDNLKEELDEYEIFFLLCSAYLHDVGMANLKRIKDYHGDNVDIIRENHHKRTCLFVKDYFGEVGLQDDIQGYFIGKICLGHRKEDLHDTNLFPPIYPYKEHKINIPLLASLLRVADELDITFERTPRLIYDNFDINNEKSKAEWKRHLQVFGVTATGNNSFIQCNARCKDPNIHRTLKRLELKINDQLTELPDHMHEHHAFTKELPRKFKMEIENEGYEYHNFKFSVDNKAILELLMGENLYKSKDECIRELLKNSIDACRFRQETIKISYKPEITFELTSNNEKLVVTDNGMGMDKVIIEEYLTKIGRSFYSSENVLNHELGFHPLNELGIGFLSCFMIANKIIIDTKTETNDPLNIEIDDTSDYFIVRKSKKESTGTDIILFLKENIKGTLNLEKIIENYARYLEFPIYINSHDNQKIKIEKQEFRPCSNIKEKGKFIIKLEEDDFEGAICFEYGEDFYSHKDIVFNKLNDNNVLCNQGILINDNINLLSSIIGSLCIFEINLKNNLLDLNIARNGIQYNDKYKEFVDRLELIISNKMRDFFLELEDSSKKILFNTFYNNWKDNFYNDPWSEVTTINSFFENPEWFSYNEEILLPVGYLELFSDFYKFTCITKNGLSFVNSEKLLNKRVIYVNIDFEGFVDRNMLEEYLEYLFNSIDLDEKFVYILEPSYIPKRILETSLEYTPELLESVLLQKYQNNLTLHEIIAPFGDKKIFIINFTNCKDNRLILIDFGNYIFINKKNKLINLIVRNQDDLNNEEKLAIAGLFNNIRNSFSLHEKYRTIIEMFVSNKKIENNPSSYLLDEKELDLCRNNYIWKNE
ncbi:ATP-binding protein [Methanobacterium sp. 42_16]|uniref:HD domain-containing protein n=1 Tax=Methanobacterium sp. 42_16 TaxID=1641383 RepID=UPI000748C0FC|nr:ATP-binding protein [Methanobacterium sp. 42_16]KUK72686.1 MAG: Molecular chaperone HSP90 family-like protein [Methanobacterium sp. 42_16]